MPPSGFYRKHSQPISAFLRACVGDLIAENKGLRSPESAVRRELSHIAVDTAAVKRGPIPTKVLELTKSFYEALLKKGAANFDELEEYSEELLASLEKEIESIKVLEPALR